MDKYIHKHPESLLKSFNIVETTFLKNSLWSCSQQVLFHYGKGKVNDKGMQEFTDSQIILSMPDSTKKLFWTLNNASTLLEITLSDNENLANEVKRMRAELTSQQIMILELQNQIL